MHVAAHIGELAMPYLPSVFACTAISGTELHMHRMPEALHSIRILAWKCCLEGPPIDEAPHIIHPGASDNEEKDPRRECSMKHRAS